MKIDSERRKHWLTLVKMQGRLTTEQQAELQELTLQICVGVSEGSRRHAPSASCETLEVVAAGVDPEIFARVIAFLQERQEELKAVGKNSLASCLNSKRQGAEKEWTFCRNFFE